MKTNRKSARIAGVLFLTAMVSSLLGGGLIESVINAPDYLLNVNADATLVSIGVILELINAIAVIGIALMLYPILRQVNQSISLGYVGFRIVESVFCFAGAIIPLFIVGVSQENGLAGASDASGFQSLGSTLINVRSQMAGIWIPLFFSLSALMFYSLLFHSKLLPRFISVWGFLGALLIFALIFLDLGMGAGMMLALPIILNEIFLGIWLIAKGFNS